MVNLELISVMEKCNKGKKRKINFENWKDVNNKRLRNSGKEYSGRNGKVSPKKNAPQTMVNCACSLQCSSFKLETIQKHFYNFYNMDYDKQTNFLHSLIELKEPQRRRVAEGTSRRNVTVEYFLPKHDERKVRVCKRMISHTFQVTQRRLQVLVEKLKAGNSLSDQRGRHDNRPHKIVDAEKKTVMEHIESFPSQESHYSRSTSKNNCLHPDLTIKMMHDLFKKKYPDSTVSYNSYRHIFNGEFKLRFGFPRSDTCKLCDKYFIEMIAAEDQNNLMSIQKLAEAHHIKSERAYSKLRDDTSSASGSINIVALCVDLQQVIFTPNLTHTDVFYQRQYSNYNFAIHNLGQNTVDMYTWHETVAKRGAAEIASCILKHITSKYNTLKAGETRKLIFWSDRCVGQNNNWTMIALIHYLIKWKYFSEVNQKFLVSGHSFLPCDRDFALIERKKKTSQIYTPQDVHKIIESARPSNPFRVHQMLQIDFKNFDVLVKNINKDKCKITEGKWLQITEDDVQVLRLRTNHSVSESWRCHSLIKKSKDRQKNAKNILSSYELPVLRNEPIVLAAEKKKDLLEMASYLPNQYAEFYRSICN